jgi:hypothetical protein
MRQAATRASVTFFTRACTTVWQIHLRRCPTPGRAIRFKG